MAYVPVPKDLTKVKTKVMFNLTKRQLICFTGGALIGVPLFFLLRKPTGNSVAAMCMMLVMLPFFMLAMYEKHGQPLEKIVGNILKVAVIRPKQRPYQTNNFYAVLKRQEMLDKEVYDIVHRNKKWLHRMFGKTEEKTVQPVKTKKKLSRADKKQIDAAIVRANRTDKKGKSAQDSIPYERMWPDGICRISDSHYTKTIQFQDINYQLSQNEDKTAIFEGWCDFLNYFDSSIHFQLSFLNLAASEETFANSISIPPQRDAFDSIREEYTTMLQNQLARGNNGLIKTKYLTFGIDADSIKAAKPRLERIETDILNNFKRLGVAARTLDGKERLSQLHAVFHMDEQLPFQFEWDWLAPSGLSTKDFIAPSSFEFRTGKQFRMGKKYGAVSFLQILAPELNDRLLADFLDMESSLIVSMHIQSVDQVKAIKTIKRKITDLDRSKIEEQKKQSAPDTTWTSFHLTLLLTAVKRKNFCRICRAATRECSF